jgi:hypothetical protein
MTISQTAAQTASSSSMNSAVSADCFDQPLSVVVRIMEEGTHTQHDHIEQALNKEYENHKILSIS